MLGRVHADLNPTATHLKPAPAIPGVDVVGAPAKKDYANEVAPAPLILEPATAPVIEVVTILDPELHWKWMQRQANDWKERSSLEYDPSTRKKKKKKGEETNHLSTRPTTPVPPDDSRLWKSNFELLLAFQRRHGHCRIPGGKTTTGTIATVQQNKLLRWVSDQQRQYKIVLTGQGETAPTLTRERIELLNSIGFEWERPSKTRKIGVRDDKTWNDKFEQLRAFHREHRHFRVPHKYAVDPSFGHWVANQRRWKKQFDKGLSSSGITQERITMLDAIGFEWESCGRDGKPSWNDKFEQLRAFQQQHGHCRVSQRYAVDRSLGQWVANQRWFKKQFDKGVCSSGIIQERIDKLDSVGFEWEIRDRDGKSSWNDKFKQLRAFQQQHGHCRVSQKYAVDPSLGQWVASQRWFKKQFDKGLSSSGITQERIDKLDSVGFDWQPGRGTIDTKPLVLFDTSNRKARSGREHASPTTARLS